MISANQTKFIKSLQLKKYRQSEGAFLVEGAKNMEEVLRSSYGIREMYLTNEFYDAASTDLRKIIDRHGYIVATPTQLEKAGSLQSNNAGIIVAEMKPADTTSIDTSRDLLLLDNINDPGNFGTIIRIADWYGIGQIVCSEDTADFYNPKTISATKGSFTRVRVVATDLAAFAKGYPHAIYGALLDGKDVHVERFATKGAILIGNESHGIGKALLPYITHPITIPRFGQAESLNAAIATGIICDVYRQQSNQDL